MIKTISKLLTNKKINFDLSDDTFELYLGVDLAKIEVYENELIFWNNGDYEEHLCDSEITEDSCDNSIDFLVEDSKDLAKISSKIDRTIEMLEEHCDDMGYDLEAFIKIEKYY